MPARSRTPENSLSETLAGFDNYRVYKGWIPERFPDIADRGFSFVHVDVDLYQPTLDSLKFFYPRMQPGGLILMDDYGFTSSPEPNTAADEFFACMPESIVMLPTGREAFCHQEMVNEPNVTRTITPADWGRTQTHRLWDWISSRQQMHHTYFTFSSGRGILGFLECAGLLRGKVLDYGSGPGFLTELLADAGLETHAADYSPKSVAHIEQTMTGRNNWKGAKLIENASAPYPDDSFDLVTCIETIEHVPEAGLPLISEMRRVLRPWRAAYHHAERGNLEENLNYCPFCDTEFHRWQHLRSLNIHDIEQLIAANGMASMLIQATDFDQFPEPSSTTPLARLQLSHHQRLGKFRNHACAGQTQAAPIPPWPRIQLSPRHWGRTQSVRSGREDKQVGGGVAGKQHDA